MGGRRVVVKKKKKAAGRKKVASARLPRRRAAKKPAAGSRKKRGAPGARRTGKRAISGPSGHGAIRVDVVRGSINLYTPHRSTAYPGIMVVRPGPQWTEGLMVPEEGQTIVALGGEHAYGYTTPAGGVAQEIVLESGDRATLLKVGLPHYLGEWRVERRPR